MKPNIGIVDRLLRLFAATAILIIQNYTAIDGLIASLTLIITFYLIGTVIIGVCPLYRLLHITTDDDTHSSHQKHFL